MNKNNEVIERPVFTNVAVQRQDAALQFMGAQKLSAKWMSLPGSRPVSLVGLRSGMCRWPIGDPLHFDAFRFCGCSSLPGDSYCDAHKKMAFAPGKSVRPGAIMMRQGRK